MAQGIDSKTGQALQGFEVPANGSTSVHSVGTVSAPLGLVNASGFYEFTAAAACYICSGLTAATIPAVGVPGAYPLPANTPVTMAIPAGSDIQAIAPVATTLTVTKL